MSKIAQQLLHRRARLILRLTGVYFDGREAFRRNVHIALALLIMALGIYESGWIIFNVILDTGQHVSMVRFVIWTVKAIIVQLLLLFWQSKGRIEALLDQMMGHFQNEAKSVGRILAMITRTWIICTSVYLLMMLSGFVYFQLRLHGIVDKGGCFRYGTFTQMVTRNFVWWTSMWILTSAMIFYNVCVRSVLIEVDEFCTRTKLLALSAGSPYLVGISSDQHEDAISKHFHQYLGIISRVESLDKAFQVYLFLMVGTTIPNTIFTLMRFLQTPITGPLHFLFTAPETVFCVFELAGLTFSAAQLHAKVQEIPKAFYLHTNLHAVVNSDDGAQRRIRKLITHMTNQPNLGITLWGFATVTKPLIMTVMSVVITYLTVILQVIPVDEKNDFWKIKV